MMTSSSSQNEVFRDIRATLGQVPSWLRDAPEPALREFWEFMREFYLAETKIPRKYKDLIGIAVSGARRCRYCALFHTEAAKLHGATDTEIAEASMMRGVTMCVSTLLNAQQTDYETFRRETLEIVKHFRQHQLSEAKR